MEWIWLISTVATFVIAFSIRRENVLCTIDEADLINEIKRRRWLQREQARCNQQVDKEVSEL